jgi:hypothetical protein
VNARSPARPVNMPQILHDRDGEVRAIICAQCNSHVLYYRTSKRTTTSTGRCHQCRPFSCRHYWVPSICCFPDQSAVSAVRWPPKVSAESNPSPHSNAVHATTPKSKPKPIRMVRSLQLLQKWIEKMTCLHCARAQAPRTQHAEIAVKGGCFLQCARRPDTATPHYELNAPAFPSGSRRRDSLMLHHVRNGRQLRPASHICAARRGRRGQVAYDDDAHDQKVSSSCRRPLRCMDSMHLLLASCRRPATCGTDGALCVSTRS